MAKVDSKTAEGKTSAVKKVKVTALVHLSGKFGLAWSEGQTFEIEEAKAKELLELKVVEKAK